MSFLIEMEDGERRWTASSAQAKQWGDEGGILLRQGVGAKPPENADFVAGAWVVDPARRTAADRKARFVAMDKEELYDTLLAIIKRGDARLDVAESEIAKLAARVALLEALP